VYKRQLLIFVLNFALKEAPMELSCALLQAALLTGGLVAQNAGIGTNASIERLHVAGNPYIERGR